MQKQVGQIGFIGATLVGLTCFSTPANSITLQTNTQFASVTGENNRVTQLNEQTSLDLFFFNLDISPSNETSNINNFINAEIFEFIDNFSVNDEISQSIDQSTDLSGINNRVTQISEQNIFDVFFLDPELNSDTSISTRTNNLLHSFDLSQILSDRIINQFPDAKQRNTQEANVFGQNNRTRQVNNQTVIDFFLVDIKYSNQLDDVIIRKTEDDWDEKDEFELDAFFEDLEDFNPFLELPDNFFQGNDPIVLESNNYSVNEARSPMTVPESGCVFSLLGLGAIGLSSAVLRKRK
jgi:hypothetical protein